MTQTFQCPNCQASLEYDETGELTVECSFCGTTVIVPEALSERDRSRMGGTAFAGGMPQQVRLTEVAQLIRLDRKIEAIKLLREITGLGLKEAKEAVEKMERGEPVQLTSVSVQQSTQSVRTGEGTATSDLRRGCLLGTVILVLTAIGLITFFVISAMSVSERTNVVETVMETAESGFGQVLPTATPGFAVEKLAFGGEEGIGPGFFNDTRVLGRDGNGNIYTGDYNGGRVQVFNAQGGFVAQWTVSDPEAPLLSMDVDREGRVYVIERGDIYRYDGASGESLGLFVAADGGAGFRDFVVAPDGKVVAYSFVPPDTLTWFDASGNEVQRVEEILSGQTGDAEPNAMVAVDGAGNVYLLDQAFDTTVFKYDATGKFITRIGSEGDAPGQFRSPTAIVVDNQGRLYVDDFDGILVFSGDGRYINTIPFRGVAFDMVVTEQNDLIVMDRNGNRVVHYELIGE